MQPQVKDSQNSVMSKLLLKCPHCGIKLEADEKDIGAVASCSECNFCFTLRKDLISPSDVMSNDFSDLLEDVKIGKIAKVAIPYILNSPSCDNKMIEKLQTLDGTKALFGFNCPLLVKKTDEGKRTP